MSFRRTARRLAITTVTSLGLDRISRAGAGHLVRQQGARPVRVLFFHGTPASAARRFRRQIAWLATQFEIVDFTAFGRLFTGEASPVGDPRPAALITFDDGLGSNYEVAVPILEEMGLRGVFFVVPAFGMSRGDEARRFFLDRMRGRASAAADRPMTPDEIRELAERGHTIGNHTYSHAWLSQTPASEYGREILESAAVIESWIDRPVDAFAWPFIWDAITPEAHRLARLRHAFCFSPCSGLVNPRAGSPSLIWRTNAEAIRGFDEFRFQCSGFADHVAAARRRALCRMLLPMPPVSPLEAPEC